MRATDAAKANRDQGGTPGGRGHRSGGGHGGGPSRRHRGASGQPKPPTATPSSAGSGDQSGYFGSVNPLAIHNPICGERGLGAAERQNCRAFGSPEIRYPTSNYGFDIWITTGVTHITGDFQALLAHIAEAIWMASLFVLNLVLTVLGWAFELNPFSNNRAMASICIRA